MIVVEIYSPNEYNVEDVYNVVEVDVESVYYTGSAVADHGGLAGLADDDHKQYQRADSVTVSADFIIDKESMILVVNNNVTVTLPPLAINDGRTITVTSGNTGTVIDTTGTDTINVVDSTASVPINNVRSFTSTDLAGTPTWLITNANGNASDIPAWIGQSITAGHVVKMGASAPEWGAVTAVAAAHASTHATGGTDAVSLAASQVTSGVLSTSRLASSGTASSSTFLRGDQSWSTPTTVANDTLWDAAGDLAVGSGADTAAKLTKGNRTQALVVGASTLEWDANHFSGANFVTGTVANTIAETLPGATPFAAVAAPGLSGVAHLHGVYLPKGTVVTNLSVVSGAQAAVTPTNQWFALCNDSRQVLRYSVNDTTAAWAASTPKTLALTSTFTTTYSGLHYIAVVVTATTMPSFRGLNIGTLTGVTGQSILSSTGLTTPAAFGAEGTAFAAATGRTNIVMGIVS